MLYSKSRSAFLAFGVLLLVTQSAAAGERYSPFEGPQHPIAEACRPDYWRYCSGVVPGRGRILSCLAGNRDRLSRPCGHALVTAFGQPHAAYEDRWMGRFVGPPEVHGGDGEEPLK